jgi:hypothetical protein
MAIAFDAVSSTTGISVTTTTFSHVCTGSDRLIFITAHGGDGTAADRTLTAASYNAVAATSSWTVEDGAWNGSSGYYLVAPATGSNTVSVTYGGNCFNTSCGAVSFTGVDQTTPVGSSATATGTSTTPTVTVTKDNASDWIIATVATDDNAGVSVTGSGTERWEHEDVAGDTTGSCQTASAGTTDYDATWSTDNQKYAVGGANIIEAASPVKQLGLLGVG